MIAVSVKPCIVMCILPDAGAISTSAEFLLLSHLLIAGCDIGVHISVRPFVRPSVCSFVRPSTFTSKFGFLDIRDSCESETLHSNCP